MDCIKWHLGFSNGFYIGHNWGLSMFWKTSCDLEIKSYSHNHFDAIVKEHLNAFCWLAWGFMANLTLILEEKLESYGHTPPTTPGNMDVFGRFNQILNSLEKKGLANRPYEQMLAFREVFHRCDDVN